MDIVAFADFMRSTKAPSRGPITADVQRRRSTVHDRRLRELSRPDHRHGAARDGDQRRRVHRAGRARQQDDTPYSDFLLHDIGTGDGIPVLPTPEFAATAQQIRTAPLWGLRTRNRLMHDGLSFTKQEAIQRHGGQASAVTQRYNALSPEEQSLVLMFLDSL